MSQGGGGIQVTEADLKDLISDVQTMQATLKERISKLNAAVDAIEAAWQGDAHRQYDILQRKANDHARWLEGRLQMMEEALQMSKDGFTANEVETMESFNQLSKASPISEFTGAGTTPSVK